MFADESNNILIERSRQEEKKFHPEQERDENLVNKQKTKTES